MNKKVKSINKKSEKVIGVWYSVGTFTAWGLLPLYWKALKQVPSPQILAHRVFWSFIFVSFLLSIKKRWPEMKRVFSSGRISARCTLSAFFLGINWFIYIWAVNANYVVESSMGYFINPLINVILGIVFLRERLKFLQVISVFLAFIGVFYMTIQYGKFPWIALSLALSFSAYGLLRKTAHLDSLMGFSVETAILSPIVLAYLVLQGFQGTSAFGKVSTLLHLLLIGSGIITATPLIWFAHGVRRIPLSMIGFIQYLSPTLMLLLAVIVFKEPFTSTNLISFGLIWGALLIYSLSHTSFIGRIEPRPFNKTH